MIMMTVGESAPEASPQRRQRLPSMSPTPATAAASMGSTPVAAARMTSDMMSMARGARWVRGRSVVPSSTSAVPERFSCDNWPAVPCTSSTSPERNETEPISLIELFQFRVPRPVQRQRQQSRALGETDAQQARAVEFRVPGDDKLRQVLLFFADFVRRCFLMEGRA